MYKVASTTTFFDYNTISRNSQELSSDTLVKVREYAQNAYTVAREVLDTQSSNTAVVFHPHLGVPSHSVFVYPPQNSTTLQPETAAPPVTTKASNSSKQSPGTDLAILAAVGTVLASLSWGIGSALGRISSANASLTETAEFKNDVQLNDGSLKTTTDRMATLKDRISKNLRSSAYWDLATSISLVVPFATVMSWVSCRNDWVHGYNLYWLNNLNEKTCNLADNQYAIPAALAATSAIAVASLIRWGYKAHSKENNRDAMTLQSHAIEVLNHIHLVK